MLYDRKVMSDEQIRQPEFHLQILQNIQYLRLYGYIQRRDWLVTDNKPRAKSQGARNANALALPAGELMRVTAGMVILQAHLLESFMHNLHALSGRADPMNVQTFDHRFANRHARIE